MHRRRRLPVQNFQPAAWDFDGFCLAHNIGKSTGREEIRSGRLKARKVRARTIITHEDAADWRASLPVAEPQSDT
jgi:hypothetical protein